MTLTPTRTCLEPAVADTEAQPLESQAFPSGSCSRAQARVADIISALSTLEHFYRLSDRLLSKMPQMAKSLVQPELPREEGWLWAWRLDGGTCHRGGKAARPGDSA